MNTKNVALVLAAGGARGMTHIGVIEEFESRGYSITSIAGSSFGALIGGIYSAGKMPEFKQWALSLTKSDIYRLMDFTMNLGFVKMDKVFNELKNYIGNWNIEDFGIDTRIIAVDVNSGKEIIFSKGDLFTAIRASIAYPTVITPLKHGNKLLVDGGILNPLPINRVKRNKNDIIVAVNLSDNSKYIPEPKYQQNKSASHKLSFSIVKNIISTWYSDKNSKNNHNQWSYIKLIDESLNLMHRQIGELTIKYNPVDILIPIPQDTASLFDYYRAEELIEYGRKQARKYIDLWESQNK